MGGGGASQRSVCVFARDGIFGAFPRNSEHLYETLQETKFHEALKFLPGSALSFGMVNHYSYRTRRTLTEVKTSCCFKLIDVAKGKGEHRQVRTAFSLGVAKGVSLFCYCWRWVSIRDES